MDNNLKIILGEFEKHRGEFVITDNWKVERLIAIGSDDFDYYYVTYDGRKLTWNTCVGRIIPLKGKIEYNEYMNFVRIAELNHYDQEKLYNIKLTNEKLEAINQHKKELTTLTSPDKFLTEVCWDLN